MKLNRVLYLELFFIHEGYLERLKFISRTVTQRRLKQVCALEPLPNRKREFVYRKLLSFRIAVQIRKVQTHWLVDNGKLGCIWRLFIYLIIFFIFIFFYLILFFFFFVRVSLECKDAED